MGRYKRGMKTRLLIAGLAAVSVLALAFGGVAATYAWKKRELANTNQLAANALVDYREALRLQIAKNAGIKPEDSDRAIAEKLTSHLYNATEFYAKDVPFSSTGNNPLSYFQTINREVANMCANLASTMVWSLGLFDIPARSIAVASEAFFTDPKAPTHAFVEAKIGDDVVAFDPTFNNTYSCEGTGELNAKEIYECIRSGKKLTWTYLGPTRPKRSIEEYPDPIEPDFYAVSATARPDEFYSFETPAAGWRDTVAEAHSKLTGSPRMSSAE